MYVATNIVPKNSAFWNFDNTVHACVYNRTVMPFADVLGHVINKLKPKKTEIWLLLSELRQKTSTTKFSTGFSFFQLFKKGLVFYCSWG